MKIPDPLMNAKDTFTKAVFRFFEPFRARLASKFPKSTNTKLLQTQNNCSHQFNMGTKKTLNLTLRSNSLKKLLE